MCRILKYYQKQRKNEHARTWRPSAFVNHFLGMQTYNAFNLSRIKRSMGGSYQDKLVSLKVGMIIYSNAVMRRMSSFIRRCWSSRVYHDPFLRHFFRVQLGLSAFFLRPVFVSTNVTYLLPSSLRWNYLMKSFLKIRSGF